LKDNRIHYVKLKYSWLFSNKEYGLSAKLLNCYYALL